MSVCIYLQRGSPQWGDQVTLSRGNKACPYVPERWYAKHSGLTNLVAGKKSPGLVTTGAGPCLVAVVHDMQTDRGAMCHITECTTDERSFIWASEVIQRMAFSLIGRNGSARRLQLFLLSGADRFRRFQQHLQTTGTLGQFGAFEDLTGNGEYNYAYYPSHAEIFPLDRVDADSLAMNGETPVPPQLPYTGDPFLAEQYPYFIVDGSSRWSELAVG